MPITPFHLGPALALKAVAGDRFSLGAFTLVQMVIDTESFANLALQRYPVHDRLHSLPGALAVSAAVAAASWSEANPFLNEGSVAWLHLGCLACAAVGACAWLAPRSGHP